MAEKKDRWQLEQEIEEWKAKVRKLEEDLKETKKTLIQNEEQNAKLVNALCEAREQIQALKEEVDKLCAPPNTYGVFHSVNEDGTINILSQGRKVKVNLHPSIKPETLKTGQELVLNEGLNVVETRGFETRGDSVVVVEELDNERVIVSTHMDEVVIAQKAEPLLGQKIKTGDRLLYDAQSKFVLERLPRSEVEELLLETAPNVSYNDIGGAKKKSEEIKGGLGFSFTPKGRERYRRLKLTPPKGILLYGPPGCGKTLIAKAISKGLEERLERQLGQKIKGYFLNIKGPELLNKWVGETERKIREKIGRAH